MKKVIILFICLFMFSACTSTNRHTTEQEKLYTNVHDTLLSNGNLQSYDIPFNYDLKVKESDGTYKYTLTISKAKVAMNDIHIMMENSDEINNDDEAKTLGIFNDDEIHMIPNQANKDDGYYSKLTLSDKDNNDQFVVYVTVCWKDASNATSYQVYFSYNINNGNIE